MRVLLYSRYTLARVPVYVIILLFNDMVSAEAATAAAYDVVVRPDGAPGERRRKTCTRAKYHGLQ